MLVFLADGGRNKHEQVEIRSANSGRCRCASCRHREPDSTTRGLHGVADESSGRHGSLDHRCVLRDRIRSDT